MLVSYLILSFHELEPSDSINHTDVEYEFEGLHYIISYYYSSYFCQWNESNLFYNMYNNLENKYWPVYMIEMMDTNKTINYKTNDVSKLFDISEFIFIHLVLITYFFRLILLG